MLDAKLQNKLKCLLKLSRWVLGGKSTELQDAYFGGRYVKEGDRSEKKEENLDICKSSWSRKIPTTYKVIPWQELCKIYSVWNLEQKKIFFLNLGKWFSTKVLLTITWFFGTYISSPHSRENMKEWDEGKGRSRHYTEQGAQCTA